MRRSVRHTVADVGTPSRRVRPPAPDSSLGLRLTVSAAAAFAVLIPFSLLAALVRGSWQPLHGWDLAVTTSLHTYAVSHPGWVRAMIVWSFVASPTAMRIAVLALIGWLLHRGARRLACWAATAMVTGGLLGVLLKLLVGRHRPDLLDPVARAGGFSFPSGHALNAALAAGVFVLVLLPFTKGRRGLRRGLWCAAAVIVGLTGLSRVFLGVHWTSDVVGGWLLGAAVVAVTAAGFSAWRTRVGKPQVRVTTSGVDPEMNDHPV